MHNRDRLIGTSRVAIGVARWANRLFLLAVGMGLVLSWVLSGAFAAWVGDPCLQTGLRLMMVVGIFMGAATERLLSALAQVVESARAGDPFVAANARLLQAIGWSLLVLQLLDVPMALLERAFPELGSGAQASGISAGGWMAVLMVFVLSRVFAAGAAMRDELAATV